MIHRNGKQVSIECDGCDEIAEDGASFNEVWAAAKRDGWNAEQVGSEWVHLCAACQRRKR